MTDIQKLRRLEQQLREQERNEPGSGIPNWCHISTEEAEIIIEEAQDLITEAVNNILVDELLNFVSEHPPEEYALELEDEWNRTYS